MMAQNQSTRKKKQQSRNFGERQGATSEQALRTALDQLEAWVKIPRPEGAKYGIRDILSVLVYAAAHQTTIEHASAALENAPSSNTVRGAAGNLKIEALEERLNQILADFWLRIFSAPPWR